MTIHVKWLSSLLQKTLRWIKEFTNLKMDGHSKSNVTPYMHIMAYHIPHQIDLYGRIRRFSGQGLFKLSRYSSLLSHLTLQEWEKNNDDARRNYFSSNHLNALKFILLAEARLQKGKKVIQQSKLRILGKLYFC